MKAPKFRVRYKGEVYYWGFIEGSSLNFTSFPNFEPGNELNDYARDNSELFTGLFDKNGKEIREGDKLSFPDSEGGDGVVYWEKSSAAFVCVFDEDESSMLVELHLQLCEVID